VNCITFEPLPKPVNPSAESFAWPPAEESPLDAFASESKSSAATRSVVFEASEPGSPLPLGDVLASAGGIEEHEAIAIALQVIDQLAPRGQEPVGRFPDIDRIALAPGGFLLTGLEPARGKVPLAGLGVLLQSLMDHAPGATQTLRLLVVHAASPKSTLSLADVARALAKWERVPRPDALATLYQRAWLRRAAVPKPVAAQVDSHVAAGPAPTAGVQIHLSPGVIAALAMGVGAVILAGLFVFLGNPAELPTLPARPTVVSAADLTIPMIAMDPDLRSVQEVAPSSSQSDPREIASLVSPPAVAAAADVAIPPAVIDRDPKSTQVAPSLRREPSAPPPIEAAPRVAEVAPRVTEVLPRVAAPTTPSAPVARGPNNVTLPAPVGQTPIRSVPQVETPRYSDASLRQAEEEFRVARALFEQRQFDAAARRFRGVVEILDRGTSIFGLRSIAAEFADVSYALAQKTPTSTRVFTSVDEGVIEPVALTTLPPRAAPGAPPDRVAVLELLIDAQGRVESAHLIGADEHFRDRWLTSAAKSWLFQPATRDGQPVKFLKRLVFAGGGTSGPS
jgi:hypothetical protein